MAPVRLARGLSGLLTSVGLSLCAASTVAQEAPRGFALPDVASIVATWPFTDRAFTAGAPTGGNGGAEATVKALADEIAYSARFLPGAPTPLIAAEATDRPPPDTTLWPETIAADLFARPAPHNDAAQWNLATRAERAQHELNRGALPALFDAIARTPGGDVAVLWPNAEIVVRNAGRAVISALETRLRQRNERATCSEAWCVVLDAVEKKAAADATTAPVEDAIADYFFEAAVTGAHAGSTREQRAARSERASQRNATGFLAPAAATTAPQPMPWEMKLVLAAVISELRGLEQPTPSWPVQVSPSAATAVRNQRIPLGGFDLAGVSVTRHGVAGAGTAGVFELAAAITFVDDVARRVSYSVVTRFSFEGDTISVPFAEVAPIAPDRPTAHMAFVPASEVNRLNRNAALAPPLLRTVATAADRRGTGQPADYYAFSILLDRIPSDARVGLRTALEPTGIAGYPGTPTALDFEGWRVLVERATFALAASPAFHFKTVYQPTPDAPPVLLGATSTLLAAQPAGTLTPVVATRPALATAFPNRVPR